MKNNFALEDNGGAIYINYNNSLLLNLIQLSNNKAKNGGVIYAYNINNITIS